MSDMNEFLEMFFAECDELLEAVATGLRQMDSSEYEKETVHAVFRAVHSVKGGAAAFGLSDLVSFAHKFETVLDLVRSDALDPDSRLMAVLHRSSDCLADLVEAARKSVDPDHARREELLGELEKLIGVEDDHVDEVEFEPISIDLMSFDPPDASEVKESYRIFFEPNADLYRSGNDPVAIIRALDKLGETEVTIDTAGVPVLSQWDDSTPVLSWTILLRTTVSRAVVEDVFEFVEDCCKLEITTLAAEQGDNSGEALQASSEDFPALEVTAQPTQEATDEQAEASTAKATFTPLALASASAGSDGRVAKAPEPSSATIRVNLDRVDKLMNMIGELVIKEAMLSQVIQTAGFAEDPEVKGGLESLRQLAGDIQESVMAIRAQPLKQVFQRMHRILREAADATGKQVRLVTSGEQTEVDKTMIERLIDPLTHMIRNSVDHGLEDAITRKRNGKPQEGTVMLSAAHKSGRVQIEVSDNGSGINRARVRQIAEDKGLIAPGATLTPAEIDALLFLPGFSSKSEVSALSGRGVGLDVVRREIMALGGRVMISSSEGKGTTFTITLPLTLAVLEGMLIQLNNQTMVLPITAVQETLRAEQSSLHGIGRSGRTLSNRDELIPIVDLGCIFGFREQPSASDDGVLIVVETDGHKRAAFQVDAIFDQRQVVIKSLEENYGRVPGVSAATILGDGKIALIIDPEEIVLSSHSDQGPEQMALTANG